MNVCIHCGKNVHEIEGWLERLNRGEIPSKWECRPHCAAKLISEAQIVGAIKGDN